MDLSKYYKQFGFYIEDDPEWAVREYGEDTHGKGDLIFNTCYKILRENDLSEWAHHALENCRQLLIDKKRWPDYMNSDIDCKTWLRMKWSRGCYRLGLVDTVKHRRQRGMTRDPYIAFYAVCKLHSVAWVDSTPIPWYLYTPEVWRWRRRLIKDKRKDYVRRLGYIRAYTTVLDFE